MKTSFIIGWACLFISLIFFDSIISQGSGMSAGNMSTLQSLVTPTGTDVTALSSIPIIGQAASLITGVWTFIKVLIQMIMLWFPNIWAGNWIWLYYFLCLPVAIGFIVSIVFILRGVHNA